MKYPAWKFTRIRLSLLSVVLGSLLLSACGGESTSTAGIGGTGIDTGVGGTGIVSGEVTGFGSVFVNDDRFKTENSEFIVDGEVLDQSALAVGMVVRLEAETEDGEYTGDATRVIYDDEVQGPIDAGAGFTISPDGTQKTFEVFGQKITIDDTGTRFADTSFASIAVNDVVEISGFRIAADEISATYVKKTDDLQLGISEVELRGKIESYALGPPEKFEIDGITIEVDRADPDLEIDVPGGVLEDDFFIEVEGIILTPTSIRARRIELEDENLGEDVDDVRLQGIISIYVDDSEFFIDGQRIDASSAEFEPQGAMLAAGIEIEVEGDIVGGVLIADEVEVEGEESELRSYIGLVDDAGGSFEVQYPVVTIPSAVTVNVDARTLFEDETGQILITAPFSLDDLNELTDYVIVKGTEVNDEIRATLVKRVSPKDKRELAGLVDSYQPGISITVLGVSYGLDGDTEYEPDTPDIEPGDFVEIEDDDEPPGDPADGIADEVEEEDD